MSSVNDSCSYLFEAKLAGFVLGVFYEGIHEALFFGPGGVVEVKFALNVFENFLSVVGNQEISRMKLFMGHSSVGFSVLVSANGEIEEEVFGNSRKPKDRCVL